MLAAASAGAASVEADVDKIERELRETESISFYFVSRTEEYNYDNDRMKSEATVVIRRSCGANCHNFMKPVLARLRNSIRAECVSGQQDLLIEFAGGNLVYSYSGRQVKYGKRCFFSEEGVHDLFRENNFFFH